MDSAKESVKKFLSKSDKHDTTVHESVNPAVTKETVARTDHENVTSAVDKEVHQDHYHTTVQPVSDREVLPEQHHTKAIPVEHRSFEHDSGDAKLRHAEEQKGFVNEQTHVQGEQTSSAAPTVAGEHRHHHVHETIQPVIQKQTIEPHVTHTTVPIHEVHHNAAQHHSASALPAVSMADFKKQGGALGGREERTDAFAGEPRHIGSESGGPGPSIGHESGSTGSHPGYAGDSMSSDRNREQGYTSQLDPARNSGAGDSTNTTSDTTGSTSKPSMMDKLNPKVDANGDGKAGFMK